MPLKNCRLLHLRIPNRRLSDRVLAPLTEPMKAAGRPLAHRESDAAGAEAIAPATRVTWSSR
jgi:hypothetical protein